jgi:hypothetical protein
MNISVKSGAGAGAGRAKRVAAGAPALLALFGLLGLADAQRAQADETRNTGWWADVGIGGAELSTGNDGITSGGGATWLEFLLGRRLNDHWLMGLEVGGAGTHPSSNNYNPNDSNSDIYGESFTHTMLGVRYLPQVDHGWVYGLGAGAAWYHNKAIAELTNKYRSGNGWAADAALGYDWKIGQQKAHVEALLNIEQGHISYIAPLTGGFGYSAIAASVHIAWF